MKNIKTCTRLSMPVAAMPRLLIWLLAFPHSTGASGLGTEIVPNPAVLSKIERIVRPPLEERAAFLSLSGEMQTNVAKAKLAELAKSAGDNRRELLLQLFYYSSVAATNMEQAMAPAMFIPLLKISTDEIISAMLPLLESADGKVRKEAAEWLSGTDWAPGRQSVDFQRYEILLRTNQPAIPLGLVRYLFNRAPRTALQTVVRVYGGDVADAELRSRLTRLDPNVFRASAKQDLEYFVARPEWWAQLFVASALADDPDLYGWDFRHQMLARLEKSDHPLVREKVADLKARFSPR